jgi:hypothetical protein
MRSRYYKVVTDDMKSLGLRRNPTILEYRIGEWVKSPTVKTGKSDDGGIWVVSTMYNAVKLLMYMRNKYNISCRIFRASIGRVLFTNSYRTKTNKVKLIEEIPWTQ